MAMRVLDLFCGGGCVARGLLSAGCEVTGIDIEDHSKSYPGKFIQGDALKPPVALEDFDAIWASPPCQAYSATANFRYVAAKRSTPKLIEPVRAMLADHPYTIIENVPLAPVRPDMVLSGPMVGLMMLNRRRFFELSWPPSMYPPVAQPAGSLADGTLVTVTKQGGIACRYVRAERAKRRPDLNSGRFSKQQMGEAMGIEDWRNMTMAEIGEGVPPAYAELVIRDCMDHRAYHDFDRSSRSIARHSKMPVMVK